jgi:hypothetical protein
MILESCKSQLSNFKNFNIYMEINMKKICLTAALLGALLTTAAVASTTAFPPPSGSALTFYNKTVRSVLVKITTHHEGSEDDGTFVPKVVGPFIKTSQFTLPAYPATYTVSYCWTEDKNASDCVDSNYLEVSGCGLTNPTYVEIHGGGGLIGKGGSSTFSPQKVICKSKK